MGSESLLNLCKIVNRGCETCITQCWNLFLKNASDEKSDNKTEFRLENKGYYTFTKDVVNMSIKIIFPIISIIGCIGNILIIFVVLRLPSLRRSYTNFFLVNMALADLGVVVWCVNLTAIQYVDADLLWVVGPTFCKLNNFFQILSYTASILLLMLICFERYFAIIFPMKVKNILSKRIYIILLIFIWLISIGFSLPSLFTFELRRVNNITNCDNTQKINRKTYLISTFVLLYILPLVLMASLYGHICFNLVKSLKKIIGNTPIKVTKSANSLLLESGELQEFQINSKGKKNSVSVPNKIFQKSATKTVNERRRVILMLIVIVSVFALCRLPRHIWSLMTLHSTYNNIILLIFPPSAYMVMYLSSAINPLIYFAFSNSFRGNFLKALCCCFPTISPKTTNVLQLSYSKYQKSNTVQL